MTLLEIIQEVTRKGYEISFFQYDGYLRVTVRTFVSCASFGFEIPEGYLESVGVRESRVVEKIKSLMDEQDRVFTPNSFK